jgi:methylated-DNA-[protein]-cysteine S-methyltransferase
MNHLQFQTRIGALSVAWNSQGLISGVHWSRQELSSIYDLGAWSSISRMQIPDSVEWAVGRLQGYFRAGEPIGEIPWRHFDRSGWTPFQVDVYEAAARIPHGETRSYSWVAQRIGRGLASRAVGQALRRNPVPLLVPCHRVVGVGALGGFMGVLDPRQPEMQLKHQLLELERSYVNPMFSFLPPLFAGVGA